MHGWVTSEFGVRPDPWAGDRSMHEGLDIASPHGQPVAAPSDGTVVFAGAEGGYGKVLVIDHGYGVKTRYGHLSEIFVRLGDASSAARRLRRWATPVGRPGPHLHYEVRVNGIPQNPRKFILGVAPHAAAAADAPGRSGRTPRTARRPAPGPGRSWAPGPAAARSARRRPGAHGGGASSARWPRTTPAPARCRKVTVPCGVDPLHQPEVGQGLLEREPSPFQPQASSKKTRYPGAGQSQHRQRLPVPPRRGRAPAGAARRRSDAPRPPWPGGQGAAIFSRASPPRLSARAPRPPRRQPRLHVALAQRLTERPGGPDAAGAGGEDEEEGERRGTGSQATGAGRGLEFRSVGEGPREVIERPHDELRPQEDHRHQERARAQEGCGRRWPRINELEPKMKALTDEELPARRPPS